ncbi:MAG TPA: hypothetical protein VIH47_06545 [Solirubrobacterales bacterium]
MLIAPLVAAMAALALTGTIGRVQRDEPLGISISIGLVIASGVFWVAASTFTAPAKEGEKRSSADIVLRSISIVLAGLGFVLALALAVSTANNEPRPQISPTLSEDGSKLTTKISASNLPTDQRLAFRIDLLRNRDTVGNVYQAYVGPNSDGDIEQTVTLPLPQGDYTEIGIKAYTGTTSPSCDDFGAVRENATFGSGTGCVIMTLPNAGGKPKGG